MKRILVHIGSPKTGSSSIQASVGSAWRKGLIKPISFFRPDEESNNFVNCLYQKPDRISAVIRNRYPDERSFKNKIKRYRYAFLKFLKQRNEAILSAESSCKLDNDSISLLFRDLNAVGFKHIQVVVYVRDPVSHYLSWTQQKIKVSSCVVNPSTYKYDFMRVIQCWENSAVHSLVFRPFDRSILREQCVVKDFLAIASEFFSRDLAEVPVVNKNESVSAESMVLLEQYRQAFHLQNDMVQLPDVNILTGILSESRTVIPQTRPEINLSIAKVIESNHKECMEYLNNNFSLQPYEPDGDVSSLCDADADLLDRHLGVRDVIADCDEDCLQKLFLYVIRILLEHSAVQLDANSFFKKAVST